MHFLIVTHPGANVRLHSSPKTGLPSIGLKGLVDSLLHFHSKVEVVVVVVVVVVCVVVVVFGRVAFDGVEFVLDDGVAAAE